MAIQEQQNWQNGVPSPAILPTEQPEQDAIEFGELLMALRRRRWLILMGTLLIFALGMVMTFLQHRKYESTCSILIAATNNKTTENSNLPLLADLQALTQGRSVDTMVEILSNPDLLQEAFNSLPREGRIKGFVHPDFIYDGSDATSKTVSVSSKKNTDVVTITVRSRDKQISADYANGIAKTYLTKDLEQNRQATSLARTFVESQLAQARTKFEDASNALAAFMERTGFVSPDEQLTQLASNLADLQAEIDRTGADTSAGQQSVAALKKEFALTPATVVTETDVSNNPRISAELATLDALNDQRDSLLQEYTAHSPEVKAIDARISAEQDHLKQLQATVIDRTVHSRAPMQDELAKNYSSSRVDVVAKQARVQALKAKYDMRMHELKQLPEQQKQLALLMMDADIEKNTLAMLAEQHQTLMISEQSTLPNIRVVTIARASNIPVSPKVMLNALLFLLLGILCSIGAAAVVERLDEYIHDQETAERMTGLTVMGAIHQIKEEEPKIIEVNDQRSMLVERFRVLRNNISFSSLDRKMRMIAVTSCGPGEGKSTCSTNLGIVMAMDGKRVLVIDCDLHRPSLHNLLKTPRGIGFTNVVMGSCALADAVVTTEYENLSFLPAGILPPNPSEVLNAQPTRQLLHELAGMYDMVILDCPPCAKLSDVQIISTIVDGMLLLIGINQTLKGELAHSYRALAQVSAPIMGILINRMSLHQHHYGYYYYYYSKYGKNYDYHYDYHEDDGDPKKTKKGHSSTTKGGKKGS